MERIDDARRIPEYVARAFATAMNGRPGPVVLVLPEDMLAQVVTDDSLRALPRVEAVQPGCDTQQAAQLGDLIRAAKRPLVIAGGSGWSPQSAQLLQDFAQKWQLPVANAFRFQDCFDLC